jgi:electron transfer flavoprotein beta subunit
VEVNGAGTVTWGDASPVVNPWDEYSLEEAIVQAKNTSGKATVIAIGSEFHNEALKHSLAMGVDEAVRIEAAGVDAADSLSYATLAAAAVKKIGAELVICGKESVDVGTDQHIYQIARKLGWTMVSYVSKILALDPAAKTIKVEVTVEQGKQVVTAQLPAVITVLKGINEPRYPSFIGIRKASKATIPVWSPSGLGVSVATQQLTNAYANPPAREVKTELIEGASLEEKAAKLVDKLLEEKVL